MSKEVFGTSHVPLSPAVRAGDFVFVSGQVPVVDGKVVAHLEHAGKMETAEFDTVISAVGIVGNVEGLGLEALGVKIDRTHVVTDEFCRTGIEGLYAIGDIAGAPWLAHKASH